MSVRSAPHKECNKNDFHFFFPTPALPVSGSKGLISAVVTATTAPLCYNGINITYFSGYFKSLFSGWSNRMRVFGNFWEFLGNKPQRTSGGTPNKTLKASQYLSKNPICAAHRSLQAAKNDQSKKKKAWRANCICQSLRVLFTKDYSRIMAKKMADL